MKKKVVLILSMLNVILSLGQISINDYYSFMNKEHLTPKEYILKQFETSDIVIIGERDHRDTTQYDLILDIISDRRFIKNIDYVYTEVGVVNQTKSVNELLKGNYNNNQEFEKCLLELYRNLDFNPLWEKYNMVKYLNGIYLINKTLENEDKITIGLTDCSFSWDGMTENKYKNFVEKILPKRDSIMAYNFIKLYEAQEPVNGTRKALIIQNRPHAIDINFHYKNKLFKNFGNILKERFGDKVKIILLNWYDWDKTKPVLTDNGKWDAAYEMTNNKNIGFDLHNSPFGKVKYNKSFCYQDIADGLVFYKPFYEFVGTIGIPKIVDKDFEKELLMREIISSYNDKKNMLKYENHPKRTIKGLKRYYNKKRSFKCANYGHLKKQMKQWLKKNH